MEGCSRCFLKAQVTPVCPARGRNLRQQRKLKLNPPFIVETPQGPVTLTGNNAAELYVRSKFLEMYRNNANYFWNNGSTSG